MKKMTIIGLVLITVGFLLGAALFGYGTAIMYSKDPASENKGIISGSGDVLDLKKGTYLVWYDEDLTGDIIVRSPGGSSIIVDETSDSESYDDVQLYGELKVEESGEQRFEYTSRGKLYITEDFSKSTYTTMMWIGAIVGILIMLIGATLIVVGRLRQKKTDQSSFFQEAPAPAPAAQPPATDEGAGGH